MEHKTWGFFLSLSEELSEMTKNEYWSSCKKYPLPCQNLMTLKFFRIKLHENPSSGGARVLPCGRGDGRTDRHDEAIVAFRNCANAPKNRQMKSACHLCWAMCAPHFNF